jgi:hypothetical protein
MLAKGIYDESLRTARGCATRGWRDAGTLQKVLLSLKDEPGGYTGFTALYGNVNVQPQMSPSGPVKDLDGNVVADTMAIRDFRVSIRRRRRHSVIWRRCSKQAFRSSMAT